MCNIFCDSKGQPQHIGPLLAYETACMILTVQMEAMHSARLSFTALLQCIRSSRPMVHLRSKAMGKYITTEKEMQRLDIPTPQKCTLFYRPHL